MYPILFEIGSFPVRSYSLMIMLGILLGYLLVYPRLKKQNLISVDDIDFLILGLVTAGFLGGRLWEVVFAWSYYSLHPSDILAVWKGGMSIQGAVTGGALFAIWFCIKRKVGFIRLADRIVPGVILGQAIGRIGCFLNGDAYGAPTGSTWGAVYQPGTPAFNQFGSTPLWPAELLEGAWDVIVLLILLRLENRFSEQKGLLLGAYLTLYSLGRFSLEFLRADSLMMGPFKVAQLTSLVMALIGVCVIYISNHKKVCQVPQASN